MKRIIEVIILLPLAIVLIFLAVANRTPVSLSINPFDPADPAYLVTVPLFWVIFGAIAVGIVLGGVAVWLHHARFRKAARKHRKEADRLRTEVEKARTPAPVPPNLLATPALPAPSRAGSAQIAARS